MADDTARMVAIFAYGSLMWDFTLPYITRRSPAILHGYRRSLCFLSWSYRGTPKQPGLILGLDAHPGASCVGHAMHIDESEEQAALEYFDERELIRGVYERQSIKLQTADGGRELRAHAYISRTDHPQYVGNTLSTTAAADIVATGIGSRGTAFEYLAKTVEALRKAHVQVEPELEVVLATAEAIVRR